jgi:hypothetical protein
LSVLGIVDAFLGSKQEGIEEAARALDVRPISQDAVEKTWNSPTPRNGYAGTNEPDRAFGELALLAKTAYASWRASFKVDPIWDPTRKDPQFQLQQCSQFFSMPHARKDIRRAQSSSRVKTGG